MKTDRKFGTPTSRENFKDKLSEQILLGIQFVNVAVLWVYDTLLLDFQGISCMHLSLPGSHIFCCTSFSIVSGAQGPEVEVPLVVLQGEWQ